MKLGILISDMSNEEYIKFLSEKLKSLLPRIPVCIFCDNITSMSLHFACPVLSTVDAYDYKGIMIASDIRACKKLSSLLYSRKKYFYVLGLEWLSMSNFSYQQLKQIYNNDEIDLVANDDNINSILTLNFKKPKFIMNSWDSEILKKIAEK